MTTPTPQPTEYITIWKTCVECRGERFINKMPCLVCYGMGGFKIKKARPEVGEKE